jgi:DNA-binding transcriptional LysR family regulator
VDRLESMKVFAQVAHRSGFAAAARDLRLSTAAVSKHVAALESRIGARLFDRTTRSVRLTEAGRVYLERCLECLQASEDADASVSELVKKPTGLLRVTAPSDFGPCLLPVVADVMHAHPNLAVDLRLSNRRVDLVEEGVDIGIRVAASLEGRFVARPLAITHMVFAGAPEYFRKHGRPRTPEDLCSHRNILFTEPRVPQQFVFHGHGREVKVSLKPVMTINSGIAIMEAVRCGLGIGVAPSFLAVGDLRAGSIEPILLDWSLREYRLFIVYPHRRFLSSKVRVFIEAVRTAFGDGTRDPWWPDRPMPVQPARPRRGH